MSDGQVITPPDGQVEHSVVRHFLASWKCAEAVLRHDWRAAELHATEFLQAKMENKEMG